MPTTRRQSKNESHPETRDGGEFKHAVAGETEGKSRPSANGSSKDGNILKFQVPFKDRQIPCERHGGKGQGRPSFIFTHGAGGGIEDRPTQDFALGFAEVAPLVLFQGTMNIQNRIKTYETVIEHEGFGDALGGRSMGARAAGTIAAEHEETNAVVLVSYPLIGKNGEMRDEILLNLPERVDVLFVIGNRDSMCPSQLFEEVRAKMKARSWLAVAEGADHSMSIKEKSGVQAFCKKTGTVAAKWLARRDVGKRFCSVSWDPDTSKPVASPWHDGTILGTKEKPPE